MTRALTVFQRMLVPCALLIAWQMLGARDLIPRYLATPTSIAAALWEAARSGDLWQALVVSLFRLSVGFGIGAASGLALGLVAGLVKGVRHFLDPIVSFLFSVPKIAFLPVFLLLLGIGDASKVSIIAFSCFFPVFVASRHAILSINKVLIWVARNMGASPATMFFRVIIPAAAPQLFTGVRIGLAHAFVVLFAAELIGSHAGLGTLISDGQDWGQFDLMFAGILCFAILGFAGDRILMMIRSRVLRGQTIGTEEYARP